MGDSWVIPSVTSLTERSVVIYYIHKQPINIYILHCRSIPLISLLYYNGYANKLKTYGVKN